MSYKPYADKKYYTNAYCVKTIPTDDDVDKLLDKASREIDTMTFNRIVGIGFDNLTEFQQEIVQKVNCQLADFEYENQDLLNSVLSLGVSSISTNILLGAIHKGQTQSSGKSSNLTPSTASS